MVEDIENILIFVCDSLRWGTLPSDLSSRGVRFKTIAQSTYSPPSFTTLSTGLYPPEHGVEDFGQALTNGVSTVYDIDGLDSSYYNEGRISDPLLRIFGFERMYSLAELDTPFWYLERDPTTHAPYAENPFMTGDDIKTYFDGGIDDWDGIRGDYRESVRSSLDRFERRLRVLEKLGVRDDTLVVLTGDHGELFGEYGDIVHTMPTSPELVNVPTVFFHPSISEESFVVDPNSDIIEHVDVVTTALSALGFRDSLPSRGVNLFREARDVPYGYSYTNNYFRGLSVYRTQSLWWRDSGYVRVENSRAKRLGYLFYRFLRGTGCSTLRQNARQLLSHYWADTQVYGTPPPDESEIIDILDSFIDSWAQAREQELDELTRERLRNLGYRK